MIVAGKWLPLLLLFIFRMLFTGGLLKVLTIVGVPFAERPGMRLTSEESVVGEEPREELAWMVMMRLELQPLPVLLPLVGSWSGRSTSRVSAMAIRNCWWWLWPLGGIGGDASVSGTP